jgi:hypothetical protein
MLCVYIYIYIYIYFSTGFYSPCGPRPSLMDFSIHRHLVGLFGWGIRPTQGCYVYIYVQILCIKPRKEKMVQFRTKDRNLVIWLSMVRKSLDSRLLPNSLFTQRYPRVTGLFINFQSAGILLLQYPSCHSYLPVIMSDKMPLK